MEISQDVLQMIGDGSSAPALAPSADELLSNLFTSINTGTDDSKPEGVLVQFTDDGQITHTLLQAGEPMATVSERYNGLGIRHIVQANVADIHNSYVKDPLTNPVIVPKETITITGDNRLLKADGNDVLTFDIFPATVTIMVFHDQAAVHQETITTGKLEVSVEHPGEYRINISAGHPYKNELLVINAD